MAMHLHATNVVVWGYGDDKVFSLEFKVSNDVGIINGASEA
jgi:L-fucose isomerase-like protein